MHNAVILQSATASQIQNCTKTPNAREGRATKSGTKPSSWPTSWITTMCLLSAVSGVNYKIFLICKKYLILQEIATQSTL